MLTHYYHLGSLQEKNNSVLDGFRIAVFLLMRIILGYYSGKNLERGKERILEKNLESIV